MGWSTIPKVYTAVKPFAKTGAKKVADWMNKAAKAGDDFIVVENEKKQKKLMIIEMIIINLHKIL